MSDIDDVTAALRERAAALQARLLATVEANLSGDVLQARSGALRASVTTDFVLGADEISVGVGSNGVPYAAIQEYGGRTPAHDIVPVKAQALAFAGGGGAVFARRVHHPGSLIPARAPFGSALDALRDEINSGLKAAVLDALATG